MRVSLAWYFGWVVASPSHWSVGALSSVLKTENPVRRVAVIGAGISGLAVAHCLTNSPELQSKYCESTESAPFQVSIYDSRKALDTTAGAGVQLNGGLAVLGKINQEVQFAVKEAGLNQVKVRSRTKAWSTENNKNTFDTLFELDLPASVKKRGGFVTESLMPENELLWTAIMRGALQKALFDTLPEKSSIEFGKYLTNIQPSSNNKGGAMLTFSDGSSAGPFDLVIGCDGIKSACKEYIDRGQISVDSSKREGAAAAVYSGLRIKYAVRDGVDSEQQLETATLTQYFGNGAFALDGTYGAGVGEPNTCVAFLIYLDENYIGPFRKKKKEEEQEKMQFASSTAVKENADWTQDVKSSLETEREVMMNAATAAGIPTLDVGPTIKTADRIFTLGVYYHNPFSLTGWSKEIPDSGGASVVLVGDAAHALPPFLGQGANQAVQDAYCLASRLYEFNMQLEKDADRSSDAEAEAPKTLKWYLKDYEKLRWRPMFDIFLKSSILGYLETGGIDGFYSKFRDLFFKTMGFIGVAELVLYSAAIPKV